jgi:eukaryotic-like serine/threonine-protein kinase
MGQKPRASWPPGHRVGRYTIVGRLALGGMAEVYLARHSGPAGFEKLVVIKKILDAFAESSDFVTMFLDEARIAAQLNHPNVVQVLELGEVEGEGNYFICMEYLAGESLKRVISRGQQMKSLLPVPYAVRIIANAAEGLGHAHEKIGSDGMPLHIVHRDVSSQNLFVTYDGVVKVVDFGIATAANRATHTQVGYVKGKLTYMSPEQIRGTQLDARSDLFSLGVVLFEAVTGTQLLESENAGSNIAMITGTEPFPKPQSRNPQVPEALNAIIDKALERDPERRFQNAHEMQAALEEFLRKEPKPAGTADIAGYMRQLFATDIKARGQILASATRGEIDTSKLARAFATETDTRRSGGDTVLDAHRRPRSSVRFILGGVAVVVAFAVLLLAWYLSRSAPASGKLTVATDPPGAAIRIDGAARGQTPAAIADLRPGEHTVTLALPGHRTEQRSLDLAPGASAEWSISLAADGPAKADAIAPARLSVTTDPPDATVKVDGADRGRSPVVVGDLSPGEHAVTISLSGYKLEERHVAMHAGGSTEWRIALSKEPVASPVSETKPPVQKKEAPGRLTLDTQPWTEVRLGKRKLGITPLVEVPLPSGTHHLLLVNPEKGIHQEIEVDVAAGKTTTQKLKL